MYLTHVQWKWSEGFKTVLVFAALKITVQKHKLLTLV